MDNYGKVSTSQDGGQTGNQTAGYVFPPFTPSDLYGTCPDRLLYLKEQAYALAQWCYNTGWAVSSAFYFRRHYLLKDRLEELGIVAGVSPDNKSLSARQRTVTL